MCIPKPQVSEGGGVGERHSPYIYTCIYWTTPANIKLAEICQFAEKKTISIQFTPLRWTKLAPLMYCQSSLSSRCTNMRLFLYVNTAHTIFSIKLLHYNLATLLNGTLSCVDFMGVTMGDITNTLFTLSSPLCSTSFDPFYQY